MYPRSVVTVTNDLSRNGYFALRSQDQTRQLSGALSGVNYPLKRKAKSKTSSPGLKSSVMVCAEDRVDREATA
jgi:hypothetical protein